MEDAGEIPIEETRGSGAEDLPIRLTDGARVATWNPGLARASHVVLRVRSRDGTTTERRSMNSGRARVREGEVIVGVRAVAPS